MALALLGSLDLKLTWRSERVSNLLPAECYKSANVNVFRRTRLNAVRELFPDRSYYNAKWVECVRHIIRVTQPDDVPL